MYWTLSVKPRAKKCKFYNIFYYLDQLNFKNIEIIKSKVENVEKKKEKTGTPVIW